MENKRTLIRVLALIAAPIVAALLLLGLYTVVTGSAPPATSQQTPSTVISSPTVWCSGWVTIAAGSNQVFTHSLGHSPEQLAVELWFNDTMGGLGINRGYYGGLEDSGQWYGAHWHHLTSNAIQVFRQPDDDAAYQVLVWVWVVPPPDYDSGWTDIAPGATLPFTHNLGITATDLTVGLWFSGTTWGINQYSYGGLSVDTPVTHTLGAFWHNLTGNSVRVTRFAGDLNVDQVRVVVVHGDPPAYDSLATRGWQAIDPGSSFTFAHGLNWAPEMLLVQGECLDTSPGGLGIHHQFAGGNHHWADGWQGSTLQDLTRDSVQAFRLFNDQNCDQFRVRAWKRSQALYLPLTLKQP